MKSAYSFNPYRVPAVKVGAVQQDILAPKPKVGVTASGKLILLGRH